MHLAIVTSLGPDPCVYGIPVQARHLELTSTRARRNALELGRFLAIDGGPAGERRAASSPRSRRERTLRDDNHNSGASTSTLMSRSADWIAIRDILALLTSTRVHLALEGES